MKILGLSAQWRVGGHLINSEKEDGDNIPSGGWLYEDGDGEWQNDETLTVKVLLLSRYFQQEAGPNHPGKET